MDGIKKSVISIFFLGAAVGTDNRRNEYLWSRCNYGARSKPLGSCSNKASLKMRARLFWILQLKCLADTVAMKPVQISFGNYVVMNKRLLLGVTNSTTSCYYEDAFLTPFI